MTYKVVAEYTQIPDHDMYVTYNTAEEFINDYLEYGGLSVDEFIAIIDTNHPGLFTDAEKIAWSTAAAGGTDEFDVAAQKLTRTRIWESKEIFDSVREKKKNLIDWFHPSIPQIYATGMDVAWTREYIVSEI